MSPKIRIHLSLTQRFFQLRLFQSYFLTSNIQPFLRSTYCSHFHPRTNFFIKQVFGRHRFQIYFQHIWQLTLNKHSFSKHNVTIFPLEHTFVFNFLLILVLTVLSFHQFSASIDNNDVKFINFHVHVFLCTCVCAMKMKNWKIYITQWTVWEWVFFMKVDEDLDKCQ